jgi:SAM-dependent methyltransferase
MANMTTVKEHYENHLSHFYAWEMGDLKVKVDECKRYLQVHGIAPGDIARYALDLGCGHGIQSIALADLKFSVVAIDFSRQLLDELKSNMGNRDVTTIEADITDFNAYPDRPYSLITCMGDTITHLPDYTEVVNCIRNAANLLLAGGQIVLSFRDLTTPLTGTSRFIPVKSDDKRIHTCFLEYFDTHVSVTDLVHEKIDGAWVQKASSYDKLRFSADTIVATLADCNFEVTANEVVNRMVHIIGKKQ